MSNESPLVYRPGFTNELDFSGSDISLTTTGGLELLFHAPSRTDLVPGRVFSSADDPTASVNTIISANPDIACGLGAAFDVELDQISFTPTGQIGSLALQFDCVSDSDAIFAAVSYNITPTTPHEGYYNFESDGEISAFGNDNYLVYRGDLSATALNQPIVGMATTPDGGGYWLVASDGGIFAFGDARFFGSTGNIHLNKPIVGMAATPDGGGYWLVASDGGIFAFGDAPFAGSMGNRPLNKPVVGMAASPHGGYWLVASDGGIFSFGGAPFYGSTGNIALNKPVVGMTPIPDGGGYWFVASDGGIFAYGDAPFHGSTGNITLNEPIVGMAAPPSGTGYWMVARDGGNFAFNVPFEGALSELGLGLTDVAGIAT